MLRARSRLLPAGLATVLLLAGPAAGRIGEPEADFGHGRGPARIYAAKAPYLFTHNVGLLTLQITNLGILGNPYNNELSAGWKGNEYLSQVSLWVGAIGEDNKPHVSASIAGTQRLEFRPSQLGVDTIYPSFEGAPGGNRLGYFSPDDDSDGRANEDFQNGKDDDGDGRIDEDFAAIGQQMFSCEYRDDTPEALAETPDHVPLGLKVRQRTFQWSETGFSEFVGIDFAVINVGNQILKNPYVGLWVDADIGPRNAPEYFQDDLAGYAEVSGRVLNPLLLDFLVDREGKPSQCPYSQAGASIVYMHDAPDAEGGGSFGDAPGYFGCVYLGDVSDVADTTQNRHTSLATASWTSSQAPYPEGDPRTDEERYDLLSRGTVPRSDATVPGDYRFFISAGPYPTLAPGDTIHFEAVLVVGNGFSGMTRNAATAQMVCTGTRVDADHNPFTGIDGKEACIRVEPDNFTGYVDWYDPCVEYPPPVHWTDTSCMWVNDDCDICSGIGGRESQVVKWLAPTMPPGPGLNTDPQIARDRVIDPESHAYYQSPGRDRRVVLQWDNRSELQRDPLSGKNFFEGYRIWRVDNWDRPSGSLGPATDDWRLLAEFRKHPLDNLDTRSPYHLRVIERRDRNTIREMTPAGPLYHVGRYEWADTSGIVNGKVYFYAVTAFAIERRVNPVTNQAEDVVIGGLPAAVQKEVVMASWAPGAECHDINVVPNPYRGGAAWDLQPSDCDATGTRIAFRNLPADWTQLRIYTLAGDLVFSGGPGESRVLGGCEVSDDLRRGGTFYWDLITRSGQDVVSGVYLFTVEASGRICRGRFAIIR